LEPLAADKGHHEPPLGLAHRTCQFVAVQALAAPMPPVASVPPRWSMADLVVAAGVFLAATLLFWPAMNQSRFAARVAGCQDNLRQLGVALANYSACYPKQLPAASIGGNLNHAGVYAVILRDSGYLPQTRVLICPGEAVVVRTRDFRIPTPRELVEAQGQRAAALCKAMGGSYGYSLGFVVDGKYQPPRDWGRARQALMADAPAGDARHRSSLNHEGFGQNVLYEDWHVEWLTTCRARGCTDHIFVNDRGQIGAGLHDRDSVIGASDERPLEEPLEFAPQQ
jgi:hypothetical protein